MRPNIFHKAYCSITSSLLNVISKNMEDTKSELVHLLA